MGFKRGNTLKAIILINATGKTFLLPLAEIVESDIPEQLTHTENREIYKKFYSNIPSTSYYDFEDRNEKNWFSYVFLSILLSTIYLTSNITGIKPAHVFGLTVPAGIFIYPLTYITSDILNEFYGLRFARKAINTAFISNIVFCSLLYLSTKIPALPQWDLNASFVNLSHDMVRTLLASSVSYIVSEHTNAFLLYKLKVLTRAKLLPLRVITSTICASLIDSFIFINIAFHQFKPDVIWKMIVGQLMIKIFYAVAGVIPIYIFRFLFKRYIHQRQEVLQ
jgi:hypothetical protein